jgi:hypothetical protein
MGREKRSFTQDLFLSICGKNVEQVFMEFGKQKSQFRISMQTPVENPLMTLESFNRQFQIGEKEREAVKWGWEQEMGKTMFHVVNAYTRGAQFEGLAAEASYRLQKVGGISHRRQLNCWDMRALRWLDILG